ncbi:uncharacterized protein LOC110246938 isoform X2 [Exaiptasia diaphana]|uniref:Uncharacterized protein n=1 Tax=Exaiptasia diaphana TaxID=2652724 RepID=A0A913XTM6_EXADI|nr:uncharacterized protein LOC110246938 isoform X2 [Exaiptasia diaphana]
MGITREEALRILELHRDATGEEIRASYKRLALKWHPDKHGNSTEATERFQEVSSAYKRLTSNDTNDEIHLSRADMFDIFAHVFFQRNGIFDYSRHAYESDDDNSDDDNDLEDELLHNIAARLRNKYDRSKASTNCTKTNGTPAHNLSEAEANKNAEELIKEEERERKKAEKRRQKKKVNEKDKPTKAPPVQNEKINIKGTQNNKPAVKNKPMPNGTKEKTQNTQNKKEHKSKDLKKSQLNGETDSSEDEPDWDQSSAFFARAAGRNPPANSTNNTSSTTQNTSKTNTATTSTPTNTQSNKNENEAATEQLDPVILKSRQLAVRGNTMANDGNYGAAIELFTEAIKMDARDFRFFGNRSYCFDRLGQYEKALQDADIAISLAPDWPKGYFRRGRALAGIKLFADSEMAFAQVLKLDKNCEDAMFELARVRVQQLEEMGFSTLQSEAAIHQYATVQSALEALLAGKVKCPNPEDIYVSDGEDDNTVRPSNSINLPTSLENKSCKSVWVGNVNAEVITEPHLQQIFAQCGKIESVKILPSRFCAFINYTTGEAAARAIDALQGFETGGQNLLLRYPNNSGVPPSSQPLVSENFQKPKLTGPVNGDECYFWRTTGCSFGERCRNRHIPENKGIDLKKVEAKYGGKL